ncbi:MAG: photosystem II protein Psb27 [Synechococcales cyanobacterium K44_A2020_017]|jgi:photosystem II Psb27 protein|uniref:photosystem II protein Psb27 n=1 Tax=Leptolyngbya sp. CCY15150 TaxID=2767772 RepID=UPI0019503D02|nr:photosystem II protein Psb27 [Leptolyngbya sp. CCY15150]MBF2088623.1 photosystem II protein Psb27 [Synechococcales cyanobacterium K32_A2020_035]MBF2095567.1 photosystem II protein Psb27 [Synechococcales cyanobacterium K44_A2020_017]
MKRILSRIFALLLVCTVAMGCAASPGGLSGDYRQDTLSLIDTLRTAIEMPEGTPEKAGAQSDARQMINDFSARYRRNGNYTRLSSFTTMQTALNALAGHYSSYPNRPVPAKLQDRLELEFKRVEAALRRGA